jgi:hypothetical protein
MTQSSVKDWLLAEAVRLHEERLGRLPDEAAMAVARDRGKTLAGRIVERARALEVSKAAAGDIDRLRGTLGWLGAGAGVAGLVLGVVAARAATGDRQVDILLATAALLLVPTLMGLVWGGLMLVGGRRRGAGGLIGEAALSGVQRLAPRLLSSPLAADVAGAFGRAAGSTWGRWRLSAVTHGFWLAYAVGALLTLVVFFSVIQYDLVWGTTLLDDASVVALVEWLAWWPSTLGFMPEAEPAWIVAGREGLLEPSARADWARFLLAMIAAWAIVPRAFLLVLSMVLGALGGRRLELDLSRPGYLRLSADLAPVESAHRRSGPPVPDAVERPRRRRRSDAAGVLAVAVELEDGADDVQRLLPGLEVVSLEPADDRAGRQAALETARSLDRPAEAVLGICSMLRTPDAGTERFLVQLSEAADAPLWLWLDESARLEGRGGDLRARRHDWSALASRAGGRIVFFDRARPDAAELARLHRGLRGEEGEQ